MSQLGFALISLHNPAQHTEKWCLFIWSLLSCVEGIIFVFFIWKTILEGIIVFLSKLY